MDNKLWEGHRIIYPELREMLLEAKKEKLCSFYFSEEEIEQMERKIKFAETFEKPVLIRFLSGEKEIHECIAFKIKILPEGIKCLLAKGRSKLIKFAAILGIDLV